MSNEKKKNDNLFFVFIFRSSYYIGNIDGDGGGGFDTFTINKSAIEYWTKKKSRKKINKKSRLAQKKKKIKTNDFSFL